MALNRSGAWLGCASAAMPRHSKRLWAENEWDAPNIMTGAYGELSCF
eukprot:COSAG01_NODE_3932_length_5522_cov_153.687258_2_plen_47_part_00